MLEVIVTQLFGRDPVQFNEVQYNITVSEATALGPLLLLTAITYPEGDPVHYSLVEGFRRNATKWFKIDPTTGLLWLVKPLDYEQNKQHLFRVSAGTSRGSGETAVLVRVADANDHPPMFRRLHYETQITEEDDRHIPKPVLQVEAVDEDAGRWGVVRYSIEGDGIPEDAEPFFSASSQFDFSPGLRHSIDNSSTASSSQGYFSSSDSWDSSGSDFVQTDWSSTRSDPFDKSFSGSTKSRMDPNNSIISSLLQTNSSLLFKTPFHRELQKYYRSNITEEIPAFSVDPFTGTVYVMKPLDRDGPDGHARYKLRVTATDGQLEAVTAVQINLKDVNDNKPFFPKPVVHAAVPENAPAGTPVVTVTAHDHDDPKEAGNARLVYSLQKNVIDEASGRPIFTVNATSGEISTALCCLDREHTGRYGLLLAATDGGGLQGYFQRNKMHPLGFNRSYTPDHAGTCTVQIDVRDVNDVPPRWARTEWTIEVPEGQPVGAVLAVLPVTDPDRANRPAYRERIKHIIESHRIIAAEVNVNYLIGKTVSVSEDYSVVKTVSVSEDYSVVKTVSVSEDYSVVKTVSVSEDYSVVKTISVSEDHSVVKTVTVDEDYSVVKTVSVDEDYSVVKTITVSEDYSVVKTVSVSEDYSVVTGVIVSEDYSVVKTVSVSEDYSVVTGVIVVPGSGRGWQLVSVRGRPEGGGALLVTKVPLNYEEQAHRSGLSLQVQVTDQGEGNWDDHKRTGLATVSIHLVDTNDNRPQFELDSLQQNLELSENAATGTVLTTLVATDQDEVEQSSSVTSINANRGAGGLVSYGISPPSDPGGIFAIDTGGTVRLARVLDREKSANHLLLVLAWDSGDPPNTATATLTVTVLDINDNPPVLVSPRVLGLPQLSSDSPAKAKSIFNLTLDDADDWAAGNGPPFSLKVDPEVEVGLQSFLKITHEPGRTSGNRGVVVPLTAEVDREMGGVLAVPLVVTDSGSPAQSATVTLTLARSSGSRTYATEEKFIEVASVKSAGGIGLGRVRGDGGAVGARYSWLRSHPLFSLNSHTGALTVAADAPTGIYEVQVSVSDATGATVAMNITVRLHHLTRLDVTLASPIEFSATPGELIKKNKDDKSLLEKLLNKLELWANAFKNDVLSEDSQLEMWNVKTVSIQEVYRETTAKPAARVWLSSSVATSPSLEMVLHKNRNRISQELEVNVLAIGVGSIGLCSKNLGGCKCCCQDKILVGENYLLVDSISSVHVGPTVHIIPYCGCSKEKKLLEKSRHFNDSNSNGITTSSQPLSKSDQSFAPAAHAVVGEEPPSCRPETCLNGGRCVPGREQSVKCICPSHTYGPRCKIIHREFGTSGDHHKSQTLSSWAWLPSLPTCSHLHISLQVLTKHMHGLLLYASSSDMASYNSFLALQIANGRPQLMVKLGSTGTTLTATLNVTVHDNTWRRLDLIWRNKTMEIISDMCSGPSELFSHSSDLADFPDSGSKIPVVSSCRATVALPHTPSTFGWGSPLELGGRAHRVSSGHRNEAPIVPSFSGCIAKVHINGKLQDVGPSLLSRGSIPGCRAVACLRPTSKCPLRCTGSPGSEKCECVPGFKGPGCNQPTIPAAFRTNSFVQLALSFTPPPHTTDLMLRFRTREPSGQLVSLSSRHGRDSLSLVLEEGRPCVELSLHPETPVRLCLKTAINDGRWHHITALRRGSSMEMSADDGDGALYKAALSSGHQSTLLFLHRQEGVVVGGAPFYRRSTHATVLRDFFNGCVDDVRLDGKLLPLVESSNETEAGAVSVAKGVTAGCHSPPMCLNVTCIRPLKCQDSWRQHYCGCDDGSKISRDSSQCSDINECLWRPCLNFGTCQNKASGYECQCLPGYEGRNCEHGHPPHSALSQPTLLLVVAGASLAALLTVLLIVFIVWYAHGKRRKARETRTCDDSCHRSSASFETLQLHTPSMKSSELLYKMTDTSQKSVSVINVTASSEADAPLVDNLTTHVCHHEFPAKAVNLAERERCIKLDRASDDACKVHGPCISATPDTHSCQHSVQSSAHDCFTSPKFESSGVCPSSSSSPSCVKCLHAQVGKSFQETPSDSRPRIRSTLDLSNEAGMLPCTCDVQGLSILPGIAGVDVVPIPSPGMFADVHDNSDS
ncbi:EGF-like domain [Trinorchestia longiramus]|nr:EGF-like domain [Trinorchestia longiramus]